MFAIILLLGVLGAPHAHAAGAGDGRSTLRVVLVPVGAAAGSALALDAAAPQRDLLAATPPRRRPGPRFPRLPAVAARGYNLAVMHRLHGQFAAKLTVGVEDRRPAAWDGLSAAVGVGFEYGF